MNKTIKTQLRLHTTDHFLESQTLLNKPVNFNIIKNEYLFRNVIVTRLYIKFVGNFAFSWKKVIKTKLYYLSI